MSRMLAGFIAPFPFSGDFSTAFADLLEEDSRHVIFHRYSPRGGGLPKLSGWQWLMGKVFMIMAASLIARRRADMAAKAGVGMKRVMRDRLAWSGLL